MKSNKIGLLFFLTVLLFSCTATTKQENALAVNEQKETEKQKNVTIYTIDTKTSITTYIGRKPTGKHNGQIAISKGFLELGKNGIIGGEVILDMKSISVDDLASKEEAKGRSVLINHLKSKDFLDVENHPTGKFKITSVTPYTTSSIATKEEFESKFAPLSAQSKWKRNSI